MSAEPAPALVENIAPAAPEPVEFVAPAAPIELVAPAPAPAPVELVVKNPSPVVIDAPYPAALPFPTHYGEPALPLRFLLLNNSA